MIGRKQCPMITIKRYALSFFPPPPPTNVALSNSILTCSTNQEMGKRRLRSVIKDENVPKLIKKLRVLSDMHENEMIHIYNTFINNIQTPEQLSEVPSSLHHISQLQPQQPPTTPNYV